MIYFDATETLYAIASFFMLGAFFGGIYNSCENVASFLVKIFLLPITTFKKYKISNNTHNKTKQKNKNVFLENTFDFAFIMICSAFFLLFSYLFLDATVRIFSVCFFVGGYILSYKFLGCMFLTITKKTSEFIYKLFSYFFYVFLYPIFLFTKLIKKLFTPIINYVICFLERHKNKKIILSKIRAIEKIYKI